MPGVLAMLVDPSEVPCLTRPPVVHKLLWEYGSLWPLVTSEAIQAAIERLGQRTSLRDIDAKSVEQHLRRLLK